MILPYMNSMSLIKNKKKHINEKELNYYFVYEIKHGGYLRKVLLLISLTIQVYKWKLSD